MINKYAELHNRILLYNACKGILRVKTAGMPGMQNQATNNIYQPSQRPSMVGAMLKQYMPNPMNSPNGLAGQPSGTNPMTKYMQQNPWYNQPYRMPYAGGPGMGRAMGDLFRRYTPNWLKQFSRTIGQYATPYIRSAYNYIKPYMPQGLTPEQQRYKQMYYDM